MATPSESRSAWLRFCDSFLQDRNIKWILTLGLAIVLGSSLMLVTSHWDGYAASLKQLIVLAYTVGAFVVGRWCDTRLALRRTGTILLGLSVLLFPIATAALHWVHLAERTGHGWPGTFWLLLALTTCLAAVVGRDVCQRFLRESQPTFLTSYLILGAAGALVPGWEIAHSPIVALLLWGVFTIGTIKVNRHLFWLVEEHRAPRIFGFFPILLLGTQFLTIFAAYFARQAGLDWVGLGSVLVAATILVTCDTVARVFEQRTGGLVRPLPWPIVLPLVVGLLLCAAGITLAAAPLATHAPPHALVPTAILVAAMMALVARRTGQQAFVWAMLVAVTVAYRYVPVYFATAVAAATQQAATAVHESQLPLAFYGLTFLPLLTVLTVFARTMARRGNELFATPLRRFATALAIVLLPLAVTHSKALFPVGLALAGFFVWQTVVLRNRLIALPALAATLLATVGFAAFGNEVLQWNLPGKTTHLALAALSGLLLWPGTRIDRRLARLPVQVAGVGRASTNDEPRDLCQRTSLGLAVLLPILWLTTIWNHHIAASGYTIGVIVALLLLTHALVWLRAELSIMALAFANFVGFWFAATELHLGSNRLASVAILGLVAQWALMYVWRRFPEWRVSQAFGEATHRFVVPLLLAATVLLCLPSTLFEMIDVRAASGSWWFARVLTVVWVFDAARLDRRPAYATLGHALLFALAGAGWVIAGGRAAGPWLPALWSSLAVAGLFVAQGSKRANLAGEWQVACDVWRQPLTGVCLAVLLPIAIGSLPFLDNHVRIAGMIGTAGLATWSGLRQRTPPTLTALALLNWQLLALVLHLAQPSLATVLGMAQLDWLASCLPLAAAAAISGLAWSLLPLSRASMFDLDDLTGATDLEDVADQVVVAQRGLLGLCVVGALSGSLQLRSIDGLQTLLAISVFVSVFCQEILAACRRQQAAHAWLAQIVGGIAVAYLAHFGVIHFGRGIAMFVVLGLGFVLWSVGQWLKTAGPTAILSEPFAKTGFCLPAVAVAIGVARHVSIVEVLHGQPAWLGINSLGILAAAAFYFWQGLVRDEKRLVVLSAVILNLALALMWRELAWHDPQFYMMPIGLSVLGLVELLKREIPAERHNPLRYLGALLILVSPTFHIVQGSWLHLLTLMLASIVVVLLAMGLRTRALISTGTAFLVADLVAMVVRGSIDHPQLLWIAGIALGGAVVALGAACELNREQLLQRLRAVGAALEHWE